ncbi:membrane protein [Leptotrichia trevisanii]|uniref:Membrane protein n=1 Tax=Leptotrichia trevisanii TaxID=109328 RepID=A0A510K0Q9_9FUSO|nr:membrane protein [Leptotrichia trevisanii]BBM52312.1 membrane protein [Leptotrichia trevisanii]
MDRTTYINTLIYLAATGIILFIFGLVYTFVTKEKSKYLYYPVILLIMIVFLTGYFIIFNK